VLWNRYVADAEVKFQGLLSVGFVEEKASGRKWVCEGFQCGQLGK